MVPKACIAHQSTGRIRLRFAPQRRNTIFFDRLTQALTTTFATCRVETNPATGSVLVIDPAIHPEMLSRFGQDHHLFMIEKRLPPGESLAVDIGRPLQKVSRRIDRISGGSLDLPGLVFVALLCFGLWELIRGNWKSPPWYTAFWYAFGMFSGSVIHRQAD